jgi:hypothetical protein
MALFRYDFDYLVDHVSHMRVGARPADTSLTTEPPVAYARPLECTFNPDGTVFLPSCDSSGPCSARGPQNSSWTQRSTMPS